MSGKKKKTSEKVNINEINNSISTPEEDDIDAALSASLDGLYENNFIQEDDNSDENSANGSEENPPVNDEGNNPESAQGPDLSEEFIELADFPNEKIEKDSSTEFSEEDVALIDDISDALADQIKSDLKKHKKSKKKGKSFWWLLTLIPFLGILVLFFKRLRRDMPVILMLLRTLIFVAFAVLFVGSTATNGKLDYYLISKYASLKWTYVGDEGRVPFPIPDPEIPGMRNDDDILNALVSVKDSENGNLMQVVVSFNTENGGIRLYPILNTVNGEPRKLKVAFEQEYLIKLEGIFEMTPEGLMKFIDRLGGIEINLSQNEVEELKKLNPKKNKKLVAGKALLKGKNAYLYMQLASGTAETAAGKDSSIIRQYNAFKAIYDKIRISKRAGIFYAMNAPLKNITTEITQKKFFQKLEAFGNKGVKFYEIRIFGNNPSETDLGLLVYGPELVEE